MMQKRELNPVEIVDAVIFAVQRGWAGELKISAGDTIRVSLNGEYVWTGLNALKAVIEIKT